MKIEKLKEKAREHEQEENWMEAMGLYSQALERSTEAEDEPDIALHNRIGDLQVRIGDLQGAVENYETAIDLYLEADLPNNAMAVCRKLERNAPGRPSVLRRMGQIRIRQGFVVDARQDFLNYAEVQLAQGDAEEALRALEEFATLAPDDVEIRLFLAEQLRGSDRPEDAVIHLGSAYRLLADRGEDELADGVREQIAELAPEEDLGSLLAAGLGEDPEEPHSDADDLGDLEPADGLDGFQTTSLSEIALDDPAESGIDVADGVEDEQEAPPAEEPVEAEGDGLGDPLAGTVFDLDESGGDEAEEEEAPQASAEAALGDLASDDLGESALEGFQATELEGEETLEDEAELDPLPTLSDDLEDDEDDLEPLPTLYDEDLEEDEEEMEPLPTLDDDQEDQEPDPLPGLDEPDAPDEEAWQQDDLDALPALGADETADALSTLDQVTLDDGESLQALESQVDREPDDADAWRQLGVRLFEEDQEERAREALEKAHRAYAEAGDPERAMRVVRELIFHEPDGVEHYQRLVEYANRTGDRALLVPAFLELAEALERTGAQRKAEVVYGQVLALDPRNPRARKALAVGTPGEAAGERRDRSGSFVDLGGMVLDEESPEQTFRWRLGDADPSGDEEADFARMLSRFKEKVATGMPADDAIAHYDLGAAYKDMGLIDEAIGQFQQTLRARPNHLPAFEMVGQCFLEKGEPDLAVRSLTRALKVEPEVEDELLGIYYYLAKAYEEAGNPESAREFYERVFSLDINFMDVTERLRGLR